MSNFWDKMKILKSSKKYIQKKENENVFISLDKPCFFNVEDYNYIVKTSSKKRFSDEEILKLSIFYSNNFRIGKSNDTIFIKREELEKILNIQGEILCLYISEVLIGSIISFPLSVGLNTNRNINTNKTIYENIKCKNEDIIMPCSTYLLLDKKYRGKGLGIALIQESLQLFNEYGGLAAYFINKISRCDNSIPIINWIFPLNLDKLDSCKFNYPRNYKNIFNINGKSKAILVNNSNIKDTYNFFIDYVSDKKMYFSPSLDFYSKWIILFPTYIIKDKEEIIGLFSFHNKEIWYPSLNTKINSCFVITCIGKNIEQILSETVLKTKEFYDVVTFYELGDLKSENLNKMFAQKSSISYVNFFNISLYLKPSDFYLPPL